MPGQGSRRRVMENGKAIEPRLKVSFASATLTDLTGIDEGIYYGGEHEFTLKILDCSKKVEQYYGETWNLFLPEKAEILEFSPRHYADAVVLWNRTNPQVKSKHRGQVYQNFWQVENVTQSENGFYNFREKDNTLLSRINLDVKEHVREYTKHVDDILIIEYPWDNGIAWLVRFQPKERTDDIVLIWDGLKHRERWFDLRLGIESAGINIFSLKITDSGTFRFRDKNFNLVLVAHLEMTDKEDDDPPPRPLLLVYISVAFVLFGLVFCWFTRKKKCWKKCCGRNKSAPQVAAPPAAHYHSESQSVVPSYSAVPSSAAQLENSLQKPTADPHKHSVQHQPVSVFVTSSPSQMDSSGESAPAPLNFLSSDSDPQLELSLPSSLPLSSDSAPSDVYTSEKLNFL